MLFQQFLRNYKRIRRKLSHIYIKSHNHKKESNPNTNYRVQMLTIIYYITSNSKKVNSIDIYIKGIENNIKVQAYPVCILSNLLDISTLLTLPLCIVSIILDTLTSSFCAYCPIYWTCHKITHCKSAIMVLNL